MNAMLSLPIALAAGMVLGLFYFGTLWLTVKQLPRVQRPELLALASYLGRTALTVLGFYLLMGGRWERLAVGVLGFLLMRVILVRRWGSWRTGVSAR